MTGPARIVDALRLAPHALRVAFCGGVSVAGALLWTGVAGAHLPPLAGKLVDCIAQSDVVVAGTVERVSDVTNRTVETTVRVERELFGELDAPSVTFRGSARFAPRERYVVFLRRVTAGGYEGVQAAGTLFTSPVQDDDVYQRTVLAVRDALRAPADVQVDQLRLALIPALRAAPVPLRYHAALELAALAHHGPLREESRRALEGVAADPTLDPALRPFLATLLRPESPIQGAR